VTVIDPEKVASRRELVAKLTADGWSATQIAKRLGVTDRTVQRDRKATGCLQGEPYEPLSAEELERARVLVEDGCSRQEVARTIGRSAHAIRRHVPESGWTREQTNAHLAALRRLKVRMRAWEGVFVK